MGEVVTFPDPFDPSHWEPERPDDVCYLSLSNRVDCVVALDRQDYEWAIGPDPRNPQVWCHTYGAGPMTEKFEGIYVMARPDHIYARRCAGGQTIWLHREICLRAHGPTRYKRNIADHWDGNTLNCRRYNLRWATPSMNARNTPQSKVRERFLKKMGAR